MKLERTGVAGGQRWNMDALLTLTDGGTYMNAPISRKRAPGTPDPTPRRYKAALALFVIAAPLIVMSAPSHSLATPLEDVNAAEFGAPHQGRQKAFDPILLKAQVLLD